MRFTRRKKIYSKSTEFTYTGMECEFTPTATLMMTG